MARVVPKKLFVRKRPCQFCLSKNPSNYIDYKDENVFIKLINMQGKILSSRITGTCAKHQRAVSLAIKRARYVAILPYIGMLPKKVEEKRNFIERDHAAKQEIAKESKNQEATPKPAKEVEKSNVAAPKKTKKVASKEEKK